MRIKLPFSIPYGVQSFYMDDAIYQKSMIIPCDFYNRLLSIRKMVSESEKRHVFVTYLKEIQRIRGSFATFDITHIPRTQNTPADSLIKIGIKSCSLCWSFYSRLMYTLFWYLPQDLYLQILFISLRLFFKKSVTGHKLNTF